MPETLTTVLKVGQKLRQQWREREGRKQQLPCVSYTTSQYSAATYEASDDNSEQSVPRGGLERIDQNRPPSASCILPPQRQQDNQAPYPPQQSETAQRGNQSCSQPNRYQPPYSHPSLSHAQSSPTMPAPNPGYDPSYGQSVTASYRSTTPAVGYSYFAGSPTVGSASLIPHQYDNQGGVCPSTGGFPQAQPSPQSMPQLPARVYNPHSSIPTTNSRPLQLSRSTPTLSAGIAYSPPGQQLPQFTSSPQSQGLSSYYSTHTPSQATPPLQSQATSSYCESPPLGQSTSPPQSNPSSRSSYAASPSFGQLSRPSIYAGYSNPNSSPQPRPPKSSSTPANLPGTWGNTSLSSSQGGSYLENGSYQQRR